MPTGTPTSRTVMWIAIGLSAGLAGGLLALGWDSSDAWATAASMLLLACVAVCGWTVAQGRATDREIRGVVARLASRRATRSDRDELHQSRSRDP